MIEVVLHIGGEKTGSTSIQASLKSSRARLADEGILYPRVFGDSNHVGIYVCSSTSDVDELKGQLDVTSPQQLAAFREEMADGFYDEVGAISNLSRIVISNEHLSARLRTAEELQNLRDFFELLGEVKYRIVYFARPQWELIPSLYSTYVKTGGLEKLVYPMSDVLHHKLKHLQIIELWQRAFPDALFNVHAFSTADETFDVVKAFAEVTGIGLELDEVPDQNVSLAAPAVELMRLFNKYVPRSISHKFNPARGNIQQLLEAQAGPPLEIPVALQRRIAAEFATDNARLNEKFGHDVVATPPELASEPDAGESKHETEISLSLDLEDAIRMLSDCFSSKQQQFLQAKARAEKLNKQVQELRQTRQGQGPPRNKAAAAAPKSGDDRAS